MALNYKGSGVNALTRGDDAGGDADGNGRGWHAVAYDRAGPDDGAFADGHAVKNLGAGAHPDAVADRHAGGGAGLLEDRLRRVREVVIAADHVAVCRHQHAPADGDPARREHFAVEADVDAVGQLDVAVLVRQDRVAADEDAVADADATVGVALGVDQAVVVDDDIAADVNLVGMAQHHVLTEHDVAAARAQQHRIQRLTDRQPQRTRPRLRAHDD